MTRAPWPPRPAHWPEDGKPPIIEWVTYLASAPVACLQEYAEQAERDRAIALDVFERDLYRELDVLRLRSERLAAVEAALLAPTAAQTPTTREALL